MVVLLLLCLLSFVCLLFAVGLFRFLVCLFVVTVVAVVGGSNAVVGSGGVVVDVVVVLC